MDADARMYLRRGGRDTGPLLVLLHGLGATGEVWNDLTEGLPGRWPGGWLVPDLPGHGRSAPVPRYSFGRLAAEVAGALPTDRELVVLGHSLGGVLGLALASGWFGVPVAGVCALGVKIRWSEEELSSAAGLARKPNRIFPSRHEAAERALKVAGLTGLWQPDSPALEPSIERVGEGWRPTMDPAAFGVGAPDLPGLLAACRATTLLAAGEHDPMCPEEHLRALDTEFEALPVSATTPTSRPPWPSSPCWTACREWRPVPRETRGTGHAQQVASAAMADSSWASER
ncbi:alpha/beta fold hydrolase [Amycolatopsis cihanbeyliensis]|uniref:Pimeloyl-ACP methyl ester carboxylesterase n=1 Tax=Amycolatopsis cihanbeyliensis TaxID=1128664 RepID=A0A542CUE4_AMYCI|nr:alpha/beta fold hydrolase [Amycolatopsis cihanbeyliensis]TQI94438.1 pimeloyl-ACP methyl ester carboxylesterase [Amycolatopsis cihanbeyliensis]